MYTYGGNIPDVDSWLVRGTDDGEMQGTSTYAQSL
jgi:hypothetical protein